ncbi:MAG: glycosyltransferase family 2 protein, partial [bacterium]|nr:glycosyltransferase family 2 protein [bacterium]
MPSEKICVYALWRDSEPHLERTLEQLEDLERLDFDFEYFFYENDSQDNTVAILKTWLQSRKGQFKHENLGARKFGSTMEPQRMELLADCRNKCKDLLCDAESQYTLLLDSDIIFNKENLLAHLEAIKSLDDCVMVTPNVRQNI